MIIRPNLLVVLTAVTMSNLPCKIASPTVQNSSKMDSPSSDELSILYYHEDMRQFSVAPGITAHINNMDDHALAVSYTMLELKVQLICRKMAMPSEADRRLGLDTQMCLKLANIAPVLSALALLDMGRLDSHTAVDVIKVAKIKSSYTPGETATSDVLPMASIVTWAL